MLKSHCLFDVVLVDDEPVICEGLKALIPWEDYGFTVRATALNGADALKLASDSGPELFITDIKMPRMNGIDLLKALRGKNRNAEVILLTGFAEFEYARDALKYGALAYLLKPVDDEELTLLLPELRKRFERAERELSEHSHEPEGTARLHLGIVSQILTYIDEHFNENITLKTVADHFFINPAYLGQLFKSKTGRSFKDYVIERKMDSAMRLLSGTDYSVSEIARRLGFDNANYFSSRFTRWAGVTPTEYRGTTGDGH